MNPPPETVKLLVRNLKTTDEISALPDNIKDAMIESYKMDKWRYHERFQYPVVAVTVNEVEVGFWVGSLVVVHNKVYILSRFFTVDHSSVMAESYEYTDSTYIHAHN
ncbi:hypothetical protein RMATCC62417_18392 [Rhizopus microsporus]|nr:hypothetical protein RMATCC62417_18392 [Rhizopus microsporus]